MKTDSTLIRLELASCLAAVLGAVADEARYRVVRIEAPVGEEPFMAGFIGAAVNNQGDVVGGYSSYTANGGRWDRPFVYSDTTGTRVIEIPPEWDGGAGDINDAGQIAISIWDTERSPVPGDWAYRYTPGVGLEFLEGFGGKTTEAKAINESGQVAGMSDVPGLDPFAYRYTDGLGMTNLGGLFGQGSSGYAINGRGWVAGGTAEHAFLFRDDLGLIDLGPGIAYGINNRGAVVGEAFVTVGHPFTSNEAFLWQDGQLHLLGRLAGTFGAGSTGAWDINEHGVVVGYACMFDSSPMAPNTRGMIWSEWEGIRNLNDFLPAASGLYVMYAFSINDCGQICGYGYFDDVADTPTFRLDPIPPKLSIERSPTNLLVSWSPAWPGLGLESAENLGGSDWQTVESGGTNAVIFPVDTPQRFFRLNLEGARGLCCGP